MTRTNSFISLAALGAMIAASGCDGSHSSIGHNVLDRSSAGTNDTGASASGGAANATGGVTSVVSGGTSAANGGSSTAGTGTAAVPGLSVSGPILVAVAEGHQCVSRGGYVWCWGASNLGQLGRVIKDPSTDVGFRPVAGLENVVEIAAAGGHSCARRSDGRVLCWGDNANGEIGSPSAPKLTCYDVVLDVGPEDLPCQPTPTIVPNILGAVGLVLGSGRSCARLGDGTTRCWNKQKPDTDWLSTPFAIADASLGFNTACAVMGDGTLSCSDPRRSTLNEVTQVSLAKAPDRMDTVDLGCALQGKGNVLCWGPNNVGQLGLATVGATLPANVQPTNLAGAKQVAVGNNFACALMSSGDVKCWGATSAGRDKDTVAHCALQPFSNSAYSCAIEPQTVPGLPPATAIAAAGDNTCAIAQDEAVWCWSSRGRPLHIPGPWESGPPECAAKKQALSDTLLKTLDTVVAPCKTANDCTEISLDLPCSHGCSSAPMSIATSQFVAAKLGTLAGQYCDSQCASPAATCAAPQGELVCANGTCLRFDPAARGCKSPCDCGVQAVVWTDTIGCAGSDLYVFQTVPCVGCGTSKVTVIIANAGKTRYEGNITVSVNAAPGDAITHLPAPVTQAVSIESGGLWKMLVLDVPEGPHVAYAQLDAPGDCNLSNNRDYVIDIPEVAQCQ